MPQLDLGQYLASVVKGTATRWLMTSHALSAIQDAVNNLGNHLGADPVGNPNVPPAIQGLTVKVAGETAHAVIQDNNPINKGIHYFLEVDNDPSFPQPQVFHLGASRQHIFTLPTKTDGGDTQNWYARGYSQYPGSNPGQRVAFGGITPTLFNMGGATSLTLLPSTGSGTAQATGQQGGSGFGTVQSRQAVGPKRNLA